MEHQPDNYDTLPRGLPRQIQIDNIELYADGTVAVTSGKSGQVIRHWQDDTKTIHLFVIMSALNPKERAIFMFSENGEVPTEVGQTLCAAFMPDSLAFGITVASMPGLPAGIMATTNGPVEGTRIVWN